MDDKDFFQKLSGEMLDFFDWVGDTLGDPLARDAVIRDLGGKPSNVPSPRPMPGDKLDAVKAYRDASHPSAEAAIDALADIAVLLDALAGQVEAWSHSFESGAQDRGHALLELMASNYFRLRARPGCSSSCRRCRRWRTSHRRSGRGTTTWSTFGIR
jgi:hypothetical protein